MSLQGVLAFGYDLLRRTAVEVVPVDEQIATDAGLLPIREFDERLGWTAGFAAQLHDARASHRHAIVEMVRQRVFGILAGYEDQNDHDALRSDAVFKIVAGRRPDDDDLASQPTLSRLENAVTASDLLRLEDWYIDQFIASFAEPPRELTLDIDAFDDPTHGQQQLTFFHGYYSQYQYQPVVITCADNDQVVLPVLLYGTAHAATAREAARFQSASPGRPARRRPRLHMAHTIDQGRRADRHDVTPRSRADLDRMAVLAAVGQGHSSGANVLARPSAGHVTIGPSPPERHLARQSARRGKGGTTPARRSIHHVPQTKRTFAKNPAAKPQPMNNPG